MSMYSLPDDPEEMEFVQLLHKANEYIQDCMQEYMNIREPEWITISSRNADLNHLVVSCHLTSESVMLLLIHGNVWDADAIHRPLMEGTVRLRYLIEPSVQMNKTDRYVEYSEALREISVFDYSESCKKALDLTEIELSDGFKRTLEEVVLTDEEVQAFKEKFPGKKRKKIQQSWSFYELCTKLADSSEQNRPLLGLFRAYKNSSRHLHKDALTNLLIWERSTRENSERIALERAHCAAVCSSIMMMAYYRLTTMNLEFQGGPLDSSFETRHKGLLVEFDRVHHDFFDHY